MGADRLLSSRLGGECKQINKCDYCSMKKSIQKNSGKLYHKIQLQVWLLKMTNILKYVFRKIETLGYPKDFLRLLTQFYSKGRCHCITAIKFQLHEDKLDPVTRSALFPKPLCSVNNCISCFSLPDVPAVHCSSCSYTICFYILASNNQASSYSRVRISLGHKIQGAGSSRHANGFKHIDVGWFSHQGFSSLLSSSQKIIAISANGTRRLSPGWHYPPGLPS